MTAGKRYDTEYVEWLEALKKRIKSAQIKAALSANKEIIELYWGIGKELYEKQENQGWGNSVVDNLERDLISEFPDLNGFSRRNLFYMKGFYSFYKSDFRKVQQLVAQIPWGHNILIVSKSKSIEPSNT
jgi:predicted nuclease of restriction endonuclease-like (RecB) superfamily